MKRFRLRIFLATLMSAILLVLAFPPWNLWPCLTFALLPWFWALEKVRSFRGSFFLGVLLSFFMTALGFPWAAYAIEHFGNLSWPVSIGLFSFFALWNQIQFLLWAVVFHWKKAVLNKTPLRTIFFLACAYAAIDGTFPKIFQDTLSYALSKTLPLIQSVDLFGALGLTFGIVFWNLALWQLVKQIFFLKEKNREKDKEKKKTKKNSNQKSRTTKEDNHFFVFFKTFFYQKGFLKKQKAWVPFIVISCFWMSVFLYGIWKINVLENKISSAPKIPFAVLQGNIGDNDKLQAFFGNREAAFWIVEKFLLLSKKALELTPKPQFLVWPETTFPTLFGNPETPTERKLNTLLRTFVSQSGVPLLFGGYSSKKGRDFNSFFMLFPNQTYQVYRKSILLPFAEYIPWIRKEWVQNWFPQMAYFGRGHGAKIFKLPVKLSHDLGVIHPLVTHGEKKGFVEKELKKKSKEKRKEKEERAFSEKRSVLFPFYPMICYEALFPSFHTRGRKKGGKLILNITNDSWFGNYGEAQLHLAISVFRSVETRLPQIRSTNTGISALILQTGKVLSPTKLFQEAILYQKVPFLKHTPYSLYVDLELWIVWFFRIVFLLLTFQDLLPKLKKRKFS